MWIIIGLETRLKDKWCRLLSLQNLTGAIYYLAALPSHDVVWFAQSLVYNIVVCYVAVEFNYV